MGLEAASSPSSLYNFGRKYRESLSTGAATDELAEGQNCNGSAMAAVLMRCRHRQGGRAPGK